MREWTKITSVFTIPVICSIVSPVCTFFCSVELENEFFMLIVFAPFSRKLVSDFMHLSIQYK